MPESRKRKTRKTRRPFVPRRQSVDDMLGVLEYPPGIVTPQQRREYIETWRRAAMLDDRLDDNARAVVNAMAAKWIGAL